MPVSRALGRVATQPNALFEGAYGAVLAGLDGRRAHAVRRPLVVAILPTMVLLLGAGRCW
ncbi:hypothetical protein ABT173_39790 [Streptomyces sp. NPDC001795]|uniref:hypothetical protein n=1 Tax=unclassified Streptomyces TaxID=2593676 RepID=UPI00332792F3